LLHPFLYVIDSKRALDFGEAHGSLGRIRGGRGAGYDAAWYRKLIANKFDDREFGSESVDRELIR